MFTTIVRFSFNFALDMQQAGDHYGLILGLILFFIQNMDHKNITIFILGENGQIGKLFYKS